MSRNLLIISIVCICIFSISVCAAERIRVENDLQGPFDRNRDGFLTEEEVGVYKEFMHIREKIAYLCRMADEGQERVNHLRAEAEELENLLRRELGQEEKPHHAEGPEAIEREIHGLLEKAEHLHREGMADRAHELRRQAEEMKADLHEHHRHAEEDEIAEVKERIIHLRELAGEAEKRGHLEKAKQLWEESKHLEGELKREVEERDADRHGGEMEEKIHHMLQEAEELERHGHKDEAHQLRNKAEKMIAEIHKHHQRPAEEDELEKMEMEIRELRELARHEKAAGRGEKAEAISREAEELKNHLLEIIEERKQDQDECDADDEDEGDDDDEDEDDELEEIEDELESLRDEVNELKEIVEELRDRLSDR